MLLFAESHSALERVTTEKSDVFTTDKWLNYFRDASGQLLCS